MVTEGLFVVDVDDREKLMHQRQMLNKRLGLDMAGNLKLGIDADIFTDDDLLTGIKESQQHGVEMDAVSCATHIHVYYHLAGWKNFSR